MENGIQWHMETLSMMICGHKVDNEALIRVQALPIAVEPARY